MLASRRRIAPRIFSEEAQKVKEVILTPEGYKKLKEEIQYLSNDKRREVAERIRVARQFGDIAEISEYDDAKSDQALLEHRIAVHVETCGIEGCVSRKV